MAEVFDNIGYVEGAEASVYFAPPPAIATSNYGVATSLAIKKLTTTLDVAPWGEDNRFPQNIEKQLAYCGMAKAALAWKAKALWGNGIIPVIPDGEDENAKEKFKIPPNSGKYVDVYKFINSRRFVRFYLEFYMDWAWFENCFPELILSNDGTKITGMVHQESSDCRFKQMDENGKLNTIYLSKLWGMPQDQFVKFDGKAVVKGIAANPLLTQVDNKYIKQLRAIDMYNPIEDLTKAAAEMKNKKYKSVILPVNFPSPNKTYYQLPAWDGSRLSGWLEIATKIPAMMVAMYKNSFQIKHHIEIPEIYMEKRVGTEVWRKLDNDGKRKERKKLLDEIGDFLKGTDNAGSALITYFETTEHDHAEYGRVKITAIDNKNQIDKELLTSASANSEILFSMGLNPDILGAGIPGGAYGGNKGGSNIREGKLIYDSMLHLEREVTLEPLYVVKEYNKWPEEIQFRHRDIVLTTLDKGTGSEKKIS
jgi:hypothetical protein